MGRPPRREDGDKVGRARTKWKHKREPEPHRDGLEPALDLVASALGGEVWASAFGHGAQHTAGPGVIAAEGGFRGRQSRCGLMGPHTRS